MPIIHNVFSPCLFTEEPSMEPEECGSSVDPVPRLQPMDTGSVLAWIERLSRPGLSMDDWTHRLMAFDADTLRGLLDGATNAAARSHLARERCKALFLGPWSPLRSPDTPALALFRRAAEGDLEDLARLTRFLQALQYAAAHDVLRRDDLLSLLGQGQEGNPLALAWDKEPTKRPVQTKDALEAWAGGCGQLCIRGPLQVQDAMALMAPDRRFIEDRGHYLSDPWHMNLAFRTVAGLLIHSRLDELPPREFPGAQDRMRQLLLALMGTDGTTRSDMVQLDHARDALRQKSAQHLAAAMRSMQFKEEEVEAVTGVPRQRDGGQARLPR